MIPHRAQVDHGSTPRLARAILARMPPCVASPGDADKSRAATPTPCRCVLAQQCAFADVPNHTEEGTKAPGPVQAVPHICQEPGCLNGAPIGGPGGLRCQPCYNKYRARQENKCARKKKDATPRPSPRNSGVPLTAIDSVAVLSGLSPDRDAWVWQALQNPCQKSKLKLPRAGRTWLATLCCEVKQLRILSDRSRCQLRERSVLIPTTLGEVVCLWRIPPESWLLVAVVSIAVVVRFHDNF
ncbi:hypothetical protein FN846DRAFT_326306 [Sphaerosporella brunnea]|uniref:Uncharacterized protein n=1 Tax=Sphaerosporella brunnea TaxID=1250544 RepID=A0A5J5EKN0_9PEZI|nr:hypothetical protein FN846DRAFT_326306 [Sphaerosporella brunnea]